MPRRPGDTEPDPPGGRAAERLREFINQRFPGGLPSRESPKEGEEAEDRSGEQDRERDASDREDRQSR
jgi:hypothetical protein